MAAPLKDQFDREVVALLAERFAGAHPGFDAAGFTRTLLAGFGDLELKARINLVADELAARLPADFPQALAVVVAVAEPDDDPVEGFAAWPLTSFVERHGVAHPTESLAAMAILTRRFSCEFAIRPFLDHHLEQTRAFLEKCVRSPDEAVRRLASEGTRPHLPWGPKVAALLDDPSIGLDLIEELRHDPSVTVRRSVANHLNDVARSHPDLVVEITGRWSADPEVDPGLIRHALRSLVKKGHPGALAVLGFTTDPEVSVESFTVSPARVRLGETIELEAVLASTGADDQRLVVDFVIHHLTANGATSAKVFKWTTVDLAAGAGTTLTKRRRLATASTRRYHAGVHRVDLQVGGEVAGSAEFCLLDSS